MPEADKIFGKFLPEIIDPPERVCFIIEIPDTREYRAALMGQLEWLGDWRCWQHTQEDYPNPPARNLEAAQLWLIALTEACQFMNCPMTCEEMMECLLPMFQEVYNKIETLEEDMGQGFQNIINNIRYGADQQVPPGQHPPEGQNEKNQAGETNPGCNKDILWAQCTQIVQWITDRATDALEIAESATNDTEFLNVLGELPVINELGIAAAGAYIDLLLEGVIENYNAQITETYKQELACLFMQKCCTDCAVTIERLYEVMTARMQTHFADFPTTFGTFFDLCAYIVDLDIDGTIVADAINMIGIGGGFLANAFFADVGDRALETLLLLAVNDANNDWEILCPDCPAVCEEYDFTISDWSPIWQIRLDPLGEPLSEYMAGVGYIPREQSGGGFQNQIWTLTGGACNALEYVYECFSVPSQVALFWINADFSVLALAATLTAASGTVIDTIDLSALTPPAGATGYMLVSGDDDAEADVVVWKEANFS